mmetsp:Transcript_7715/g.11031  ORF Transcript_7715/g.11031 Transcript_7715/m.11031 type:complete len:553 (+) Transcript_7715:49-1707(+)
MSALSNPTANGQSMIAKHRLKEKKANGEDANQFLVQTPYGKGLIIRTRDEDTNSPDKPNREVTENRRVDKTIKEIKLIDWESSARKGIATSSYSSPSPTMLYTTEDYKTVLPAVHDDVLTQYGRGRVVGIVTVRIRKKNANKEEVTPDTRATDIREEKKTDSVPDQNSEIRNERVLLKYKIELTSWRLAGRSKTICHLFSDAVRVVRKKRLFEMDTYERIELAQDHRISASNLFSMKKYKDALNIYATAVDSVRYVQHSNNSNNECRADLIEVLVACSNNAATCCVKLGLFPEAERYAKNALILLDALYSKKGRSIHTILISLPGMSNAKLFGEWRAKSCIVIGKTQSESGNYDEAIETWKKGRKFLADFLNNTSDGMSSSTEKNLGSQEREISKLISKCALKKKALLRKEKARARAMFGGGSDDAQENHETNSSDPDQNETPPTKPTIPVSSRPNESKIKSNKNNGLLQEHALNSFENTTQKEDDKKNSMAKRVSFAQNVVNQQVELNEATAVEQQLDEEDEPWYQEHKEALAILAIGGLAALSMMAFRRK